MTQTIHHLEASIFMMNSSLIPLLRLTGSNRCLLFATLLVLLTKCDAFLGRSKLCRWQTSLEIMTEDGKSDFCRRGFLATAATALLGYSSVPVLNAEARDEIFKPNPLTNPLLEQIRIWEQAEADDIKYGGELTPGDAGNKGRVDQYPKLLVPILKISRELKQVDNLVHGSKDDWAQAMEILEQSKYDKVSFKKTFNMYADNIYYSDPDRANLYLGGGATPKTEQSIAYLLRNEILTNIEALQAELRYLLKGNGNETEDLYQYSADANRAMSDYLKNVSPYEMELANELLAKDGFKNA